MAPAYASAVRWYELTRDPVALEVATRAVTADGRAPVVALGEVERLVSQAPATTEATRVLWAQSLAGRGRADEAWALLTAGATGSERPAYGEVRCAIGAQLQPRPVDAPCGWAGSEGSGAGSEGSGSGR